MLYGGKKIIISLDEDEYEDVRPDDDDEGNAIVVQFWVSPYSDDEHSIEVEMNGESQIPLHLAGRVARSIAHLVKWPATKAGKKEIERLRIVHEEYEAKQDAKRAARAAGIAS